MFGGGHDGGRREVGALMRLEGVVWGRGASVMRFVAVGWWFS